MPLALSIEGKKMKRSIGSVAGVALLAVLTGCATRPLGPTVAVMPAANKNFDQFQQEQAVCKGWADQQVGYGPQQANNQAVGGALLTTALGAGLGAAAGGGVGAAIGAASGAVAGTALGAGYSGSSSYAIQRQYNIAYAQCMAAHGNKAPTQQAAYNPKVDADGNETAGVRSVQSLVPLGTYLGWNVTASGFYKGQGCGFSGGYIPFAKTKAERTAAGDPRPSLEERYGTHEAFVAKVRAAADKLVGERFLLKADADRIVGQAADSAVLMPSGL